MWLSIIAIIISAASLIFSILQYSSERARNRSEATIHAFDTLEAQVFSRPDYKKLPIKAGEDRCNGKKSGDWATATNYLSLIEHFCAGVQMKTYDIKTLNRLAGGFMIEQYRFWTPIINTKRAEDGLAKMKHYNEFEDVVKELCAMRGEPCQH
ncbi:DUF4760 domain-containing protein [Oscillibacter ruminantium]|uniref:DUF4760 domain-containing protein n=1 Tax=Oscillibacter ruminantium TaxID=1263547 RepID=UPI00332E7493